MGSEELHRKFVNWVPNIVTAVNASWRELYVVGSEDKRILVWSSIRSDDIYFGKMWNGEENVENDENVMNDNGQPNEDNEDNENNNGDPNGEPNGQNDGMNEPEAMEEDDGHEELDGEDGGGSAGQLSQDFFTQVHADRASENQANPGPSRARATPQIPENGVNYRVIPGLRQNSRIAVFDKYQYIKDTVLNRVFYMKCKFASCPARATIKHGVLTKTKGKEVHSCPDDEGQNMEAILAAELLARMKKRAATEGSTYEVNYIDDSYLVRDNLNRLLNEKSSL